MQMPANIGPFHIIGIGGIGMSAIAEILVAKGYTVQGSDQKESANVKRLRAKGIRVFVGHDAVNLIGARYVVISTAVKATNPELAAARDKGLTIIRRAEMLAELMRLYSTVSVTGTHGKTTTTSLLSHIFTEAGQEPTVITGGIINAWGSNARLGQGKWMIVEADESDGTFTRLPTEIGIVTNIDPEHLDYFGSVEVMHREYETFLKNIPFFGLAIACVDHPVVRAMINRLNLRADGRRLLTYGVSKDADLILENVRIEGNSTRFDAVLTAAVRGGARRLDNWSVPIPGAHNALNALAAIAVATEAGIEDAKIHAAMAGFSGVKRRFQLTGEWNGVAIYDDYGHHPAEISAVLAAARGGAKGRSSRSSSRIATRACAICLKISRPASAMPITSSSRRCIRPAKARLPALIITRSPRASAPRVMHRSNPLQRPQISCRRFMRQAKPGDSVVCLGAGASTDWAHALPEWLAQGGATAGSAR